MIAGRHALVTGGGSGVGRAIALALAGAGVDVTICGRREAPLAAVAGESSRIFPVAADVTDEASMSALYEKAEAARGPFDIVVANAGMAGSAPAARTIARRLAAHARRQSHRRIPDREAGAGRHGANARAGRIVFIASTAGLKGYAYVAPYVAAKHGVVGLMRALAAENARTGVTVNAVCPGFVETDMLEESVQRDRRENRPQRRGNAQAVAWRTTRRAASSSRQRSRRQCCGCAASRLGRSPARRFPFREARHGERAAFRAGHLDRQQGAAAAVDQAAARLAHHRGGAARAAAARSSTRRCRAST